VVINVIIFVQQAILTSFQTSGIIWNITGAKSEIAQVGIPGRVKLFACGEEHCLAVTEENEVYSWGNSLYDNICLVIRQTLNN
jgi:alpha-tubulin suppressor-like RCC1 family protein